MNNKTMILITILVIFFSICGATFWRVNVNHEQRMTLVVEKRIIEAAQACYNDDNCSSNKVTLGELIQKGYAKKEINPLTKTYYSLESYVIFENKNYTFIAV